VKIDSAVNLFSTLIQEPPKFDLACVGTSILGLRALTLESITYFAHADVVYYYPVTACHLDFMRELNDNVIDMNNTLYRDGRRYQEAYSEIIDEVLSTARSGKRIAYAVQGSPAFLAYTSIELIRRAKRENLHAVMVPGVSSFECLLATVTTSHDLYDVQLYNCATVVYSGAKINPHTACCLFNLAVYASPVISKITNQLDTDKVEALRKSLRKFYSDFHTLTLVYVRPDGQCDLKESSIASMIADLMLGPQTVTILIPAID